MASSGGTLSIGGLRAGTYGVKYTTAGEHFVDNPDVTINIGQDVITNIPAGGVVTIYGR